MECMSVREALSAQLDGEEPILTESEIATHCETCSECEWWQNQAGALHRQVRIAPADDVPNLTAAIMEAVDSLPLPLTVQERSLRTSRVLLAACAVWQIMMTLPMLFGSGSGPAHLDHELGSWDLALSAGLLFAALRPARAWGMLPLVGAVAAALGATAVIDVAGGNATLATESAHLLELVGLLILWNIARLTKHEQPRRTEPQLQPA
jgi:predicted anti-sigma-YlaC factor YlaD